VEFPKTSKTLGFLADTILTCPKWWTGTGFDFLGSAVLLGFLQISGCRNIGTMFATYTSIAQRRGETLDEDDDYLSEDEAEIAED